MTMPYESQSVSIPDLELDAVQITFSTWLVMDRVPVLSGDSLCEVSAGDVCVEVLAPCSGVLRQTAVDLDEELQTGDVIAEIETDPGIRSAFSE